MLWLFRLSRPVLYGACAVVLVLSVIEMHQQPAFAFSDKVSHLSAFALLALLAEFAFPGRRAIRLAMWGLLFYGLFIECVQWLLPWREFSLFDWLADALGILIWMACARRLHRTRFMHMYVAQARASDSSP